MISFEGKKVYRSKKDGFKDELPDFNPLILDTEEHAQRVFKALKHLIPFYNDKDVKYINNIGLEDKF